MESGNWHHQDHRASWHDDNTQFTAFQHFEKFEQVSTAQRKEYDVTLTWSMQCDFHHVDETI